MNVKRVAPIALGMAAAGGLLYFLVRPGGSDRELFASGTVEATDAALGFQVAGRIDRVIPREGDLVKAGDTLGWLDQTEQQARLVQAREQLAAARAVLRELETGSRVEELAQAQAAARAAEDRLDDAQRDFERTQRLLQGGAASQEAFDKSKLALDIARSQRDQAAEQLKLVQTGPRQERVAAQRAAVAQSEAAVAQVEAAISNAVIRAPFDGVVTVRDREPGETVAAGAPVLTLTNLSDRWVRIYIREDRIGAVRIGQPATISSDTYRNKTYPGEVAFIASEAEFTPRNVQTTEERVKLVYAVKVRIAGDPSNELKPGMPADVRLDMTGQTHQAADWEARKR